MPCTCTRPNQRCLSCLDSPADDGGPESVVCTALFVERQQRRCSHPPGVGRCLFCCDFPANDSNGFAAGTDLDYSLLGKGSTVILRRQRFRHVDEVRFCNCREYERFIQPWERSGGSVQRAGLLLGRFLRQSSRDGTDSRLVAAVEAIYEPPQASDLFGVALELDPREAEVERITAAAGLRRIGWILTHLPRNFRISAAEVRTAARFQQSYISSERHDRDDGRGNANHFVTVLVSHNARASVTNVVASQASDQCVRLEHAHCVCDAPGDQRFCSRRRILDGQEEDDNDDNDAKWRKNNAPALIAPAEYLGPDRRQGIFDARIFDVPLRVVEAEAKGGKDGEDNENGDDALFVHSSFPVASQQEAFEYLLKLLRQEGESIEYLADLRLLLFLPRISSLAAAEEVARCVAKRERLPARARQRLIAQAHAAAAAKNTGSEVL